MKTKLNYEQVIINPEDKNLSIGKQYYSALGVVSLISAIDSDQVITLVKVDASKIKPFTIKNRYGVEKQVSMLYPVREYTFEPVDEGNYYCMITPSPKALLPLYSFEEAVRVAKSLKTKYGRNDAVRILRAVGKIK